MYHIFTKYNKEITNTKRHSCGKVCQKIVQTFICLVTTKSLHKRDKIFRHLLYLWRHNTRGLVKDEHPKLCRIYDMTLIYLSLFMMTNLSLGTTPHKIQEQ